MAMQVVNPQKPEHLRAFNPDRDMIWAMPRLMRRVFEALGEEWSRETLAKMLEWYDVVMINDHIPPDEFDAVTEDVVTGIAKMFKLMQRFPHKAEEHAAEYARLKEVGPEMMLLFGGLLMDIIFSELPTWFDQVRPKSKLSPAPDVEEIEQAANEFLGRIGK